jgi:DNA-binding IclR family transcriptional regulator
MANSNMVLSLTKALDILSAVSNAENGIRLNELADGLGMKKTTAHNLIRTLRARDFLVKDEVNRFHIGPAVNELVINQHRKAIMKRAESELRNLCAEFPSGILTFSERCGSEIYSRLRMSPDQPSFMQHPVMQTFNPYTSATGGCFMAFSSSFFEEVSRKYPFDEYATPKWSGRQNFEAALSAVRRDGFFLAGKAWSSNEGFGIAVPVGEQFALALRINSNIPDAGIGAVCKRIIEAAAVISRR